ncbi:hypothetical protein ACVFYP_03100 [Roseomonas sp. F4]
MDARIPLRLIAPTDLPAALAAQPEGVVAALLIPEGLADIDTDGAPAARFQPDGPRHAMACACCAGRSPVAAALDQLFQARVRGSCAWFGSVIALVPDEGARAEVETALRADAVTSARFRPG